MEAGLAEELEGGNEEGEIVLASARSEKIALGEGELGWDEATGVETLELAAVVGWSIYRSIHRLSIRGRVCRIKG